MADLPRSKAAFCDGRVAPADCRGTFVVFSGMIGQDTRISG
jgi:hypothetical protein